MVPADENHGVLLNEFKDEVLHFYSFLPAVEQIAQDNELVRYGIGEIPRLVQRIMKLSIEVFNAASQIAHEESELLFRGLSAFMTLNSYTVSLVDGNGGEGIYKLLNAIKQTFSLKNKDGKEVVLSMDEMFRLGNEVSDMVETRLKYLFKEKGVDNG